MADSVVAFLILQLLFLPGLGWAQTPRVVPPNRVASVLVSQDFLNEQMALHNKSDLLKDLRIALDPEHEQIFLRGKIQIPLEELRAVKLDPHLGLFQFQVSIKPETTVRGHLILEFPLNETFFYPAYSHNLQRDRVIVPVQMLALALASARGYLSALSGDFSGFDRRTKKLEALMKGLNHLIAHEQNPDALDDLQTQRDALRLQIAAIPVERKQLQAVSKEVEHILGFTGEKELNLNDDLGARQNALILKIKLSQLVPYLNGVELGGVRMVHDKLDGNGENYLAVDVNSALAENPPPSPSLKRAPREAMKVAPLLMIRLKQSLFESQALVDAEKKQLGSNLRDMKMELKEDGLHVSGKWHKFFFSVPFETIVDFVTTGPDVFEVRVRELEVGGIDFAFLTGFVLEALKKRFDSALGGMCSFEYVGQEKDRSRAMRVTINARSLLPAFPDLHVVTVDVREREFLLKIGRL